MIVVLGLIVLGVVLYEVTKVQGSPNSGDSFIDALANAIASAEGSNPDINNPGDLTAGDFDPSNVTGTFNSAGVAIVDTVENGWAALTNKLSNILNGSSSVYSPDMTISQFAQTYTGGDNSDAWANTVSSQLGVTPDTTLGDAAANFGGN